MIVRFQRFWRFLTFYLKAQTVYGLHAPFVYHFVSHVIEKNGPIAGQEKVRILRSNLLKDKRLIQINDFGAGSSTQSSNQRSVESIARFSATPQLILGWISKTIQHYDRKTILELGTSIGISSIAMSYATKGEITSLEGCREIAEIARQNMLALDRDNIHIEVGEFQNTLRNILGRSSFNPDFIYFDGDHRKESVIRQFELCLKYANEDTIMVLDDIYWSKGMMQAWRNICSRPEVRLSVDLFFSGYLFFNKEILHKQHYRLVKKGWKPWQTGIRLFHPRIHSPS